MNQGNLALMRFPFLLVLVVLLGFAGSSQASGWDLLDGRRVWRTIEGAFPDDTAVHQEGRRRALLVCLIEHRASQLHVNRPSIVPAPHEAETEVLLSKLPLVDDPNCNLPLSRNDLDSWSSGSWNPWTPAYLSSVEAQTDEFVSKAQETYDQRKIHRFDPGTFEHFREKHAAAQFLFSEYPHAGPPLDHNFEDGPPSKPYRYTSQSWIGIDLDPYDRTSPHTLEERYFLWMSDARRIKRCSPSALALYRKRLKSLKALVKMIEAQSEADLPDCQDD